MGDYKNQADFAGRIGKIAKTYERAAQISREQNPQEELYEATLHICLLHTLLTSCHEVLDKLKKKPPRDLLYQLNGNYTWGLSKTMVQTTFEYEKEHVSIASVIQHMRNAVSHPADWKVLSTSPSSNTPQTGFYRSKELRGQIAAFTFIDSPDIKRNGKFWAKTENQANDFLSRNRHDFPEQDMSVEKYNDNGFVVSYKNKPYVRFFNIEIPVDNLQEFVQELFFIPSLWE